MVNQFDSRASANGAGAGLRHYTAGMENLTLTVIFALTVALPLAEALLRPTLGLGITGVTAFIQHLTLALGMLGAAVAAREQRLIALALPTLFGRGIANVARLVSGVVAAAVTVLLCIAAMDFVLLERESGNMLAPWLPAWMVELSMPIGYGLIAWRLAWHAAGTATVRIVALVLIVMVVLLLRASPLSPDQYALPALLVLAVATVFGLPIFAAIGGAALFLLERNGVPATSVAVDIYSLVVNPSLPAIPMFTLAGYFLAESQAPRRLVVVFKAWFGNLHGGAAIVTILACTFFTCFTGASGVTILALGGLVMPLLIATGYTQKSALGLVTGAGLPGVILMPALPLILFAIVAGVGLGDMFLAGILPTLLMVALVLIWGIRCEPRRERGKARINWAEAYAAVWAAKWELTLPLVPALALTSGLATPVEAAAITALYAFVITVFVHRDLHLARDVPRVVAECAVLVGGILIILGAALALTNYLVDAQIPDALVTWVTGAISERWLFLLALNGVLLVAGCLMDIYSAIVVIAPLVTPIGLAYGVDPVHLGIIFLANMELGYLTPPVGMNLFFASYRFGRPMGEICRAVIPLFLWLGTGVLIVTYLPWLSTALPALMH